MKLFITSIFLILSFYSIGQTKRVKIAKKQFGTVKCHYGKSINLESQDTYYTINVFFQNSKYSSITDLKFIHIHSQNHLDQFLQDMIKAYKQMLTREKVTMYWTGKKYQLSIYDFNSTLYITATGDGVKGDTQITKGLVKKMIIHLSRIEFGKDELLNAKKIDEIIN